MRTKKDIEVLAKDLLNLEKKGEYVEALGKLKDLWNPEKQEPVLEGLDIDAAAEILLRCGSLVGFLGHLNQTPESQERSKNLLTKARARFLETGDKRKLAECETYLALSYSRTGEYREALNWCDESLSREIEESGFVRSFSIVAKSLILAISGKHDDALDFCFAHEQEVDRSEDEFILGCFNGNFGIALKNRGRTLEAIDKFENSRAYHKQSGHMIYLGSVENDLALVYKKEGRFGEAQNAIECAVNTFEILGDKARMGASLDTKAQIFLDAGNYKEALVQSEESIKILKEGESTAFLADAYFTRAKTLVLMDDVASATLSLYKAMELARANAGIEAGERLAKEFEVVIRKKSLPQGLDTHGQNKIYGDDLELVFPPSMANYDDCEVVRIRNSHLEEIGIPVGSLAVVVEETIKRGDLIALSEIVNDSIICGFYDYFAGIVSLSGINTETLLFNTEEVKVLGKIIGVGAAEPDAGGKIHVKPFEV